MLLALAFPAQADPVFDVERGLYDAPFTLTLSAGTGGTLLYSVSGPGSFGYSLAAVGDVDGDGPPDILVGAPGVHVGSENHGAVYLLSGATGAVLLASVGPTPGLVMPTPISPDFSQSENCCMLLNT